MGLLQIYMSSWSELYNRFRKYSEEESRVFLSEQFAQTIQTIKHIAEQSGKNVLYYASAFLQKSSAPGLSLGIDHEDINGFMCGVDGCDADRELLLILHTPGGLAGAAETIVEYLRSKFKSIDVAIPVYAMSAGTMIALGCDRIIMDHQSQMGPIDPQMAWGGRYYSAHSIVGQFERAKREIIQNSDLSGLWAPVLSSIGPALLEEARRVHSYGKTVVEMWFEKYMFADRENPSGLASEVANYSSSDEHGAHG